MRLVSCHYRADMFVEGDMRLCDGWGDGSSRRVSRAWEQGDEDKDMTDDQ